MLRNQAAIATFAALLATNAADAQSATVTASHNHPTGHLQPGQTIRITHTLRWTGASSAATIAGDAITTPNLGTAANQAGAVGHWAAFPNFGTVAGGSVLGVDLRVQPPFIIGPTPYMASSGLPFLWYDWTAPSTPGTIDFNWEPHPDFPTPLFYLSFVTEVRSPLPTTYLGTSITVIPAPAPVALGLLSAACWRARRRR